MLVCKWILSSSWSRPPHSSLYQSLYWSHPSAILLFLSPRLITSCRHFVYLIRTFHYFRSPFCYYNVWTFYCLDITAHWPPICRPFHSRWPFGYLLTLVLRHRHSVILYCNFPFYFSFFFLFYFLLLFDSFFAMNYERFFYFFMNYFMDLMTTPWISGFYRFNIHGRRSRSFSILYSSISNMSFRIYLCHHIKLYIELKDEMVWSPTNVQGIHWQMAIIKTACKGTKTYPRTFLENTIALLCIRRGGELDEKDFCHILHFILVESSFLLRVVVL